jgi:hypothetical protein
MRHSPRRRIFEWVAAAFLFAAAVVVFEGGICGSSSPTETPDEDKKTITVVFRNDGSDNIHILGVGESPINADVPIGNRLTPGGLTRTWTSPSKHGVGDHLTFRAIRAGAVLATRDCTVTTAVLAGGTSPSVVFDEPPAQLLCPNW